MEAPFTQPSTHSPTNPNNTRPLHLLQPSFDEVYIVSELMDIDMHNLMYLSREKITPDHVQFFVYQARSLCPFVC